jgi:short-subunit dehydrogenase
MQHFTGKRALITGAGTGIGALLAKELAQRGASVIVTARRKQAAEKVVGEIRQAGGDAHAMVLDVGKINSFDKFRETLHADHGPIDILINNAGVVFGGEFEQVDLQQHLDTFNINATGLMALTHTLLPDLLQAQRAWLVNISSASAFIGLPFGSTYAASKWAVLGFSESLRLELKERGYHNVTVTSICPSYISTGMFDGVKSPLLSPMLTPEKVVKSILRGMEKGAAIVQEPPMVRSVDLFKGLLPRPVWDEVAKRTGISTSMRHWRGKQ